jgi:hypothetical protein
LNRVSFSFSGNAGNGLAEPVSQRALPHWRRRELLPHDGVLRDRRLERNEYRALCGSRLDPAHGRQQQREDESQREAACSPERARAAVRIQAAARMSKDPGSCHAGHIGDVMVSGIAAR